jgi:hypothetical protein
MNGTTKLIKNVKPGDIMAPHGGIVNYVVKTKCRNEKAKMVVVSIIFFYSSFDHKNILFVHFF